jgi:outer membrane protein
MNKSRFFVSLIWCLLVSAVSGLAQNVQKITLKQAEDIAVANHPRVREAQMNAFAAGETVKEARSAYFPIAYGSLTGAEALDKSRIAAGGLNNPIIFDRYSNGITASQLVTDFGRTKNLVASARLDARSAQEDVNTARADILLDVDNAYYTVLRAAAVLKVAQETVSARQIVADQVSALAQSKLKSDLDASFANVNLAEAKLMLVQAQNDLKTANAQLSATMGFSDQRQFELVEEPLPGAPLPDLTGALAEALRKRPELSSLRYQRDAAEKFAKAERDLWFPTVSAVGAAGFTPLHDSNLEDRYAAAAVNVNIPIFNGYLFSGRKAKAQFEFRAEQERLRDMEDQISRDIRIAWLNADTAFQRLALTRQLLDQASLSLDLAQARYQLGLGSIVEVTQAQLNKTQAEIAQASARYEYQDRRAILLYEMGDL